MIDSLLAIAGPPQEVLPDGTEPPTQPPAVEEPVMLPTFLQEIVSNGEQLTIRFRAAVPADLLLALENDAGSPECRYWRLLDVLSDGPPANPHVVRLAQCPLLDEALMPVAPTCLDMKRQPRAHVLVRWNEHESFFPLRYDDKELSKNNLNRKLRFVV